MIRERLAWDPARPVGRRCASPTSCWCCAAAARSRRCATTPRSCASTRAAGPRPGPWSCTSRTRCVEPAQRGSGLAAWLRALPLQAARRCAAAAGCAPDAPIVLVAEMEPPRSAPSPSGWRGCAPTSAPASARSIPAAAPYAQPDFRPPERARRRDARSAVRSRSCCAASGARARPTMPAAELAAVVDAIYAVYGVHVPAAGARSAARGRRPTGPLAQPTFRLLPPTA